MLLLQLMRVPLVLLIIRSLQYLSPLGCQVGYGLVGSFIIEPTQEGPFNSPLDMNQSPPPHELNSIGNLKSGEHDEKRELNQSL